MSESLILYKSGRKERIKEADIRESGNFIIIDYYKEVDGMLVVCRTRYIHMGLVKEIIEDKQ